jgi:hypothetical protein
MGKNIALVIELLVYLIFGLLSSKASKPTANSILLALTLYYEFQVEHLATEPQ